MGVAIYTHIDVESDNSTTENGYPNELISSGVIYINNTDVGHKYHTILFDNPLTVETDKLYWIAIATTNDNNQFMKILKDHPGGTNSSVYTTFTLSTGYGGFNRANVNNPPNFKHYNRSQG